MTRKLDLTNVMANKVIRNHDIFNKTDLKCFDDSNDNGSGYAQENQKVYTGDDAKKVLAASLIEGKTGKQIYEEGLIADEGGWTIGNTMVAHRIASNQTGALKDVPNAKELLFSYIDFIEENYAPF